MSASGAGQRPECSGSARPLGPHPLIEEAHVKLRRITLAGIALLAAGVLTLIGTAPAAAHGSSSGSRSLAAVLAKDGGGFDRNWNDFDIVDNAVRAVLAAKPSSPVAVLADGTTRLTASCRPIERSGFW
jgi:hypothetical protein